MPDTCGAWRPLQCLQWGIRLWVCDFQEWSRNTPLPRERRYSKRVRRVVSRIRTQPLMPHMVCLSEFNHPRSRSRRAHQNSSDSTSASRLGGAQTRSPEHLNLTGLDESISAWFHARIHRFCSFTRKLPSHLKYIWVISVPRKFPNSQATSFSLAPELLMPSLVYVFSTRLLGTSRYPLYCGDIYACAVHTILCSVCLLAADLGRMRADDQDRMCSCAH